MKQQPVNFAVIGCGALARQMHIPNIARSERTVLHTCCDLSEEALAECRERFGALHTLSDWRAAVADPEVEAICLATTEKLRLPVIEAAVRLGKPVYVEKPLARSLEEMYAIRKIVNESKVPCCVGHNRRSSPAMIDAHALFRAQMENPRHCRWRWDREGRERPRRKDDGVATFSCRINDDWYSWKRWVFDPEQAPHGPMLFEMTHFTDLCNWFLDAEPVEVVAMETGMLNHSIIIRYSGGELATLTLCGNGSFGYPKELYEAMGNGAVVVCDHMCEVRTAGIPDVPARITYPFLNDRHPDVGTEGGISGWLAKRAAACAEAAAAGDPLLQFGAEPDKGHFRAIERFADEIRGTGPRVCDVNDAVLATRVAFAAIRSAAERRIVKLDEI